KIEPHYHGSTVHVVDASRAVGVVSQLLSETQNTSYTKSIRDEYQILRERHKNRKSENEFISIHEARENKFVAEFKPTKPNFFGLKDFSNYSLETLSHYIDWTPFFHTWELAGSYPAILNDEIVGESAKQLFADAKDMLAKIIDEKWFQASAVIEFFPANSVGDDIEIYTDETRKDVLMTLR